MAKFLNLFDRRFLAFVGLLLSVLILTSSLTYLIVTLFAPNQTGSCANNCFNLLISTAILQFFTILFPLITLTFVIRKIAHRYSTTIGWQTAFTAVFLFLILPVIIATWINTVYLISFALLGTIILSLYLRWKVSNNEINNDAVIIEQPVTNSELES